MYDYRLIEAFAAVLEAGGFEKAAQVLCITQSGVSQRIRQLEEQAGAVLLVREIPPRPTEKGSALWRHVRQVRGLEADLDRSLGIGRGEQPVHLCVGVNADSLATWLLDALLPFLADRGHTLEILSGDQDQTLELLRTGRVEACISSQAASIQGCVSQKLGTMVYVMCSSPACKDENPELEKTPLIRFDRHDLLQSRALESLGVCADLAPVHFIPSNQGILHAVIEGLGWAMIPLVQAQDHLDSGRLTELDRRGRIEVPLYWHCWTAASRDLRSLGEAVLEKGRAVLSS